MATPGVSKLTNPIKATRSTIRPRSRKTPPYSSPIPKNCGRLYDLNPGDSYDELERKHGKNLMIPIVLDVIWSHLYAVGTIQILGDQLEICTSPRDAAIENLVEVYSFHSESLL